MKKITMWAIALFISAAPAVAQNNTFNMVITMANGTTITIGPNEVKNITFNEGQVVVSGENLDKIVALAGKSNERIDSLGVVTDALRYLSVDGIESMKKNHADLMARIVALEDYVQNLGQSVGGGSTEEIERLQEQIVMLEAQMKAEIKEYQAYTKTMVAQVEAQMNALIEQETLERLKSQANMEQDLFMTIEKLSAKINALEKKIVELEGEVDALTQ
jgi:chromosome segregation ATPase